MHGNDYWELSAVQAAAIKYLQKKGAAVILNTHMREGLAVAQDIPGIRFLRMKTNRRDDGTLHFTYEVEEGRSESYGIETVKDKITAEEFGRAIAWRETMRETLPVEFGAAGEV